MAGPLQRDTILESAAGRIGARYEIDLSEPSAENGRLSRLGEAMGGCHHAVWRR